MLHVLCNADLCLLQLDHTHRAAIMDQAKLAKMQASVRIGTLGRLLRGRYYSETGTAVSRPLFPC